MAKSQARIELREFNLGIASHQYWVRYSDSNHIVGELHGQATDPKTNERKAVGDLLGRDKLKPYTFQGSVVSDKDEGLSGLYRVNQEHKLMAQGEQEIVKRWDAATKAAEVLKAREISYNIFGGGSGLNQGNSNTIADTFGQIMGFPSESTGSISGRLVTGHGKNLLPKDTYAYLYHDWSNTGADVHLAGDPVYDGFHDTAA